MKKTCLLAFASFFVCSLVHAISLDDIQLWTGSGTNRAALVVQWNTPILFNYTTVPAPVAEKTLVWGYRFNGTATGIQMFNAIVAADPRLYAVENIDPMFGANVDAIGFNLNGAGRPTITDGTVIDTTNAYPDGILIDPALNVDAAYSMNSGDLFWSGHYGPYWQLWTELGDNGGFLASPNRGTNQYWDPDTYNHGQWSSAYDGLSDLTIQNGSWLGFSVSADGYTTNEPALDVFNNDEQAPPSPDGTYVAYVSNTNDFAVQVVSSTNVYTETPYNDPTAILGRPTLQFLDPFDIPHTVVTDRVSIVDPPFNVTPAGSNVITEISPGGQITVKLGRKVYDDPNNPYGTDLIVYGYSFFAPGLTAPVSDTTDLNAAQLSSGFGGDPTIVSVSQDGTNWFTYTNAQVPFPEEAFRWDDTNDSWTDEQMNPTKPLDPAVYAENFAGESVASGLDQFMGATGGTGYDLKASGFPWVQYVRVQAETNAGVYAVIDAIAAVDPVAVGDAQAISPNDLASGFTNLVFQNPARASTNLITINFDSVSEAAKVYTVGLHDFSSFTPVIGNVSSAYQITLRPMTGGTAPGYVADLGLRAGDAYHGNGGGLRVYQWTGTNWTSEPFSYDAGNNEVRVAGLTNLSAFAVSQIVPPRLDIQKMTNGFAFQFMPVPNCPGTLERSTNFVTWTPLSNFTATNSQAMALEDTNIPTGKAFYRLLLNP